METGKIQVKVLFSVALLILMVEFAVGFTDAKNLSLQFIILAMARIAETAGILLSVMYLGNGLGAIGITLSTFAAGLKRGMIWSLGFGIAAAVIALILYFFHINPIALIASGLPEKREDLILMFLVGGIIGPVAEEVFFRGVCYGFFRRWGVILGIILTTAVFVSAHSFRSAFPFAQIIGGIVFALAYEIEKSLMAPITIHVTGNLAIFTLSIFK